MTEDFRAALLQVKKSQQVKKEVKACALYAGLNKVDADWFNRNDVAVNPNTVNMFSILSRGRSSFHLRMLEATFILTTDPILCRQKEFVRSLSLSAWKDQGKYGNKW